MLLYKSYAFWWRKLLILSFLLRIGSQLVSFLISLLLANSCLAFSAPEALRKQGMSLPTVLQTPIFVLPG
jgi:hypothetical protein